MLNIRSIEVYDAEPEHHQVEGEEGKSEEGFAIVF